MLEDKDIQKIGEEMGRVIEDNVTPVLDEMNKKIDKLDQRVDKLDQRVIHIEAEMVTKSYLDDKLGDLKGDLIIKLRREDEKVNLLIRILHERSVITTEEVKQFKEFQIFPKIE